MILERKAFNPALVTRLSNLKVGKVGCLAAKSESNA
jgi:hypothetical protein